MRIWFLLATLLFLASCASGEVGVIAPLSGEYAFLGEDIRDAMLLKEGAPELIFEDDASCNVEKASSAARKLIYIDDVNAIISACTNTVPAIYPLAAEAGIPFIQLFESPVREAGTIYQVLPSSLDLYSALGRLHANRGRICIVQAGTPQMENNAAAFKEGVEREGAVVVLHEKGSFRGAIEKCSSRGGVAILPLLDPAEKIAFFREYIEIGADIELLADVNDEVNLPSYPAEVGELLEGKAIVGFNMTGSEAFKQNFQARYGREPLLSGLLAYDAIGILQAIQKGEEIAHHEGALGAYSFDKDGLAHAPMYLKRLVDREFRIISAIG